jgi:hypothetical protein
MKFRRHVPHVEWETIENKLDETSATCVFHNSEACARTPTTYKIYNTDVLITVLTVKKAYCDYHKEKDPDYQRERRIIAPYAPKRAIGPMRQR